MRRHILFFSALMFSAVALAGGDHDHDHDDGAIYIPVPGPAGPPGPPGPEGPPGPAGAPGLRGLTPDVMLEGCTLTVNDVSSNVCGAPGLDGAPGVDGAPGLNGADGATGAQGPKGDKGDTGAQGIQGVPGMLDVREFDRMRGYMSAVNALQVHMPTEVGATRVTLSTGRAYTETAIAIGIAHQFDSPEKAIVTGGVSKAKGQTVWQAGVSFEF